MPQSEVSKDWKIVAKQAGNRYLIQTGPDISDPMCRGRVLDMGRKILFQEFNVQSIFARGYWEDYDGPQEILSEWLKNVTWKDLPTPKVGTEAAT